MSKLRDFIGKVPELCGSDLPEARGFRNLLVFDYELNNKESVFSRNEFKKDNDRLNVLFDFDGDEKKKAFCKALLRLKMYQGYKEKEKVSTYNNHISSLTSIVENESDNFPEILAVYSLEDASDEELRGWS